MVNINMWRAENLGLPQGANGADQEISFFDVKELHNLAHAQKERARLALREYRLTAARAAAMDAAYRAQLSRPRRAA